MLSYRHAFHAGNHADVLKHALLIQVLEYIKLKDKPFLYVDTHAGAGMYDLRGSWAGKTHEYEAGIARIWRDQSLPDELRSYIDIVRNLNSHQQITQYPGSPWLAQCQLRENDKVQLFELHPNEFKLLSGMFAHNKHVRVEARDGFQALTAILPPESRRAVVLIDPSYEVKTDFKTVVQAVQAAYKRFATGVYLIWYPVVSRNKAIRLQRDFAASGIRDIVSFELAVTADTNKQGMTASGVIVVNPPWQLESAMKSILPYLHSKLAIDEGGAWSIERLAAE